MDVVVWLRCLGLRKYEATFRENDNDETVLPKLTAEDLKELAVMFSDLVGSTALSAAWTLKTCARLSRPMCVADTVQRFGGARGFGVGVNLQPAAAPVGLAADDAPAGRAQHRSMALRL